MTASPAGAALTAVRTVGVLALLGVALPANAAAVATALLLGRRPPRVTMADSPRTVLITGGKMTKALQLARSFSTAGHRVVLAEQAKYRFTGHRFSRSVDRFRTVPKPDAPGYAAELARIVREEGVDVYVPVCSPLASRYDALAKEALGGLCEVVHPDPDTVRRLDDKHEFARLAASLGLDVPDTHRITDPQQVVDFDFAGAPAATYILKSIAYDPVHRLDLTPLPRPTSEQTAAFARSLPISADNPWILQEFVAGREYCTHSTVRNGRTQLWCCCASSPFQVNYAMVEHPAIEAWAERFTSAIGVTGQVSFDFIETDEGRVVAIECNPRTHSAITLFGGHPGVAAAYLEDGRPEIRPRAGARPTYWTYHELWRILSRPSRLVERLGVLGAGRDAVLDPADPLPFLMLHHLQIPLLLLGDLLRLRPWLRIDFNIGKLVEPGGD